MYSHRLKCSWSCIMHCAASKWCMHDFEYIYYARCISTMHFETSNLLSALCDSTHHQCSNQQLQKLSPSRTLAKVVLNWFTLESNFRMEKTSTTKDLSRYHCDLTLRTTVQSTVKAQGIRICRVAVNLFQALEDNLPTYHFKGIHM